MSKDATPVAESVEVTQADREAVSDLSPSLHNPLWSAELADAYRAGKRDNTDIVLAFARHRLAAYEAGRAEGVREAAEVADRMAAAVRTKMGRGRRCDAVTAMAAEILDNAAKHIRAVSKEPTK